jgi:predicted aspartyl protease
VKNLSYAPIIRIGVANKTFEFLIDTGASSSCVNENIFKNEKNLKKPMKIQTAGGCVTATKTVSVPLFSPFNKTFINFLVAPCKLPFTGLIGIDIMEKLSAQIDLLNSTFSIPEKEYKIFKKPGKGCNQVFVRDTHLNLEEKEALYEVLENFPNIFQSPDSKLTFTTEIIGTIETLDDRPVYLKSYPYPYGLKDEVEKQILKMLNDGIISQSRSPYNAPLWVVPKKVDASGEKKYRYRF